MGSDWLRLPPPADAAYAALAAFDAADAASRAADPNLRLNDPDVRAALKAGRDRWQRDHTEAKP